MCRCNSRCGYRNYNQNLSNSSMYSGSCQNQNTTTPFPTNYLYGHAYTPTQNINNTYNPEIGLQNGSIFPELVSSYSPGQSIDFINYLRCGGNQNG